ncbi:hypothetical protein [Methylobacterium currus]|uniref:hypothetical protein n=1 Tax=Methylobacterium currus TaxID=2051553 RepID=UPI001AEC98A8|nr:hypothetical protein [Methylobacterium currus]
MVPDAGDGDTAYAAANEAVIGEAQALAAGTERRRVAVIASIADPCSTARRAEFDPAQGVLDLALLS